MTAGVYGLVAAIVADIAAQPGALPLMQYALEHGTLLEHKLFVPDGHPQQGEWTFAASFLYPAAGNGVAAPLDRASLIEHLF